jgi:hypothetical protein
VPKNNDFDHIREEVLNNFDAEIGIYRSADFTKFRKREDKDEISQ